MSARHLRRAPSAHARPAPRVTASVGLPKRKYGGEAEVDSGRELADMSASLVRRGLELLESPGECAGIGDCAGRGEGDSR